MTSPQLLRTPWRKSSHSGSSGQECVEVAPLSCDRMLVRDSKNPHGPVLSFTPAAWTAFLNCAKEGVFDLAH